MAAAALLVAVLSRSDEGPVYRPGQDIDGLTRSLSRTAPEDAPQIAFSEVAEASGIVFRHFPGVRESVLYEDMAGGMAWGDYDADGDADLFLVNFVKGSDAASAAFGNRLYRNEGTGSFTDVSKESGLALSEMGSAAAWGDYDADGLLDLWTTAYGQNRLFRNDGDGEFREISTSAGLSGFTGFWTGVSPGDYDRDGDLDVYVTGYVKYEDRVSTGFSRQYEVEQPASLNPSSFPAERNLLFRNDGAGRFTEVAAAAGVDNLAGRSLSAAWADLNGDGHLDLYVANDVSDNILFLNNGDGTFEDVSHTTGVADYRGAMGLGVGDWDRDGDQDLFITHWIAQENALFDNLLIHTTDHAYGLRFSDIADRKGLGQSSLDYVGWATGFFDFDLDGREDLFVVNGSTFQMSGDPTRLIAMRPLLYWNAGTDRGFYSLDAGPGFGEPAVGRGGGVADYDGDGDLDILMMDHGGAARLLRNDSPETGGWLRVALEGPAGNTAGLGAVVRVHSAGETQTRQVGAQASYLSQHDPALVFGLGNASGVDSVTVDWVTGERSRLGSQPAGVTLVVPLKGDARRVSAQTDEREATRLFWESFRAASTHRLEGRPQEAAAAYARALTFRPEHEDALYYLGAVRRELGEDEAAVDAWYRLLEVNPRSARALMQLGSLRLCRPGGPSYDPQVAKGYFERAHAMNRAETGGLARLGMTALAVGDLEEAERQFDAVLLSDPGNKTVPLWRAFVDWRRGDETQARARVMESTEADARASVEGATGADGEATVPGEGDTRGGTAMTAGEGCPLFDVTKDSKESFESLMERLALRLTAQ